MKSIQQNLNQTNPSNIYPFFWQHGESKEVLEDYLIKMQEQKINHFCIESRPHPDFVGEGWWKTVDFILEQAKQKGMTFWILDDVTFPTGSANHKVPDRYKKQYLAMRRLDFKVSMNHSQVFIEPFVDGRTMMKDKRHVNDTLFKVLQTRHDVSKSGAFDPTSVMDVTDQVDNGLLTLDVDSASEVSLFIFFRTFAGLEDATKDHLDMMNPDAVDCLIQEVYEPHFKRYGHEFGKTIEGFFSDEPRFGNAKGNENIIGRTDMPLPWNDLVEQELMHRGFAWEDLIDLFFGKGKKVGINRALYMDVVTDLYAQHFSQRIGNWCSQHHVDYIGHVIEDNHAHQRLGYGPGHFFKAQSGQSYAGVDIIGGQIVPGMDYQHTSFATGGANGSFYHYTLLKLGASCAKLDPRKNKRLMCEAFGAYGWVEGLKMMKWITDHMIVHGVNWIVPHAFDPKAFPDWDCPPHFYAQGNNPQYPYFHKWSEYASRLCALMSTGYSYAKVGVLYTADAEWNGETMQLDTVLKVLENNQIGADIISEQHLFQAKVQNNIYTINGYDYDVLLVLDCDGHSPQIEQWLSTNRHLVRRVKKEDLNSLATEFENYKEVKLDQPNYHLSFMHQVQEDGDLYVFQNTSLDQPIDCTIQISTIKPLVQYDAMNNKIYPIQSTQQGGIQIVQLHVDPYGLVVLATMENTNFEQKAGKLKDQIDVQVQNLQIKTKAYTECEFTTLTIENGLKDLSKLLQNFSGTIRYEFDLDLDQTNIAIDLREVSEIVDIWMNGQQVDTKIVPPYTFDLSQSAKQGINHIRIDVINTLARAQRDSFSQFIALDPVGIQDEIAIFAVE